jgi:hypothetical protein
MTTEANFPLQQLCLKPSLYGRFSPDHLWPVLGDHRGADQIGNEYFDAAINQPVDEDCDGDLSGFAAFCGLYQSQLCKVGILGCGVFLTFEFAAA